MIQKSSAYTVYFWHIYKVHSDICYNPSLNWNQTICLLTWFGHLMWHFLFLLVFWIFLLFFKCLNISDITYHILSFSDWGTLYINQPIRDCSNQRGRGVAILIAGLPPPKSKMWRLLQLEFSSLWINEYCHTFFLGNNIKVVCYFFPSMFFQLLNL